jgi:hypothetical protein
MHIPLFPDKSVSEDQKTIYDISLFIDEFEAYIDKQIIGDIQRIIENKMGVAAYILISCAIDCLSSFWRDEDSTGVIYKAFIDEFFNGYDADNLYKHLRCRLVHNYTLDENIIICWGEASIHKSRTDKGETVINLEQFFEDFKKAKSIYFERLRLDRQLQVNLANRWLEFGILSPIHPSMLKRNMKNSA